MYYHHWFNILRFEKIVSIGILVAELGSRFFDYEYLHEFEAKIGPARNVV